MEICKAFGLCRNLSLYTTKTVAVLGVQKLQRKKALMKSKEDTKIWKKKTLFLIECWIWNTYWSFMVMIGGHGNL